MIIQYRPFRFVVREKKIRLKRRSIKTRFLTSLHEEFLSRRFLFFLLPFRSQKTEPKISSCTFSEIHVRQGYYLIGAMNRNRSGEPNNTKIPNVCRRRKYRFSILTTARSASGHRYQNITRLQSKHDQYSIKYLIKT